MDYTVHYHHNIPDDLSSIPSNIKTRIKKAIEQRLMTDPIKYGDYLRRSLKGYRKMRIGDYRIIYKINKKEILIFKIGHRKDVYKSQKSRKFC